MTTKHTVTDSRGQVHKRTSKSRVYTHAIVLHYAALPPDGTYRGREAYSKACWASSLALAHTAASSEGKHAEAVEIIPAVIAWQHTSISEAAS